MFSKLCALLRKRPESLAQEPIPTTKKRPTIKKPTRVVSAKKTTPKKVVKKTIKK
jgi:hypothetical protein